MDLQSTQAQDRMRELEREFDRPSPLFIHAVTEVATKLGLDPAPVLAGEAVEARGSIFHFVHFGSADAEGLTLFVRVGELVKEPDADMIKGLLEYNAASPGPRMGFYGVLPGTRTIILRTRFDLAKADPADDVLRFMAMWSAQLQSVTQMLQAGVELANSLSKGEVATS
jgi:hypothetical protein